MARHNTTGSTERHWIPGQEGKSINRGEVNSIHTPQTVAMVIREGWPHFLELVFHPWIFPRKTELFCLVILLIFYFEFPHIEGQILPWISGASFFTLCALWSSLSQLTSSSGMRLDSHLLFTSLRLGKQVWLEDLHESCLGNNLAFTSFHLGVEEGEEQKRRNQPIVQHWAWT